MFPLRNGLHYKYLYKRTAISQDNQWIDSGSVEYLIKYSIDVSPTLRLWIISEDVNLLHQYYFPTDQFGGMRLDSSYLINRKIIDTLQETLLDSHILSCKSYIWQFPLGISSTPQEIFARYSSSSDTDLLYNYENRYGPGFTAEHYTISTKQQYLFEKDIGLKSISYDYYLWSNVGDLSIIIRVTLI
jgi:hypothetical protein